MKVGFKVESVAPVSTRVEQGFSLIFTVFSSPWLFKGITVNSLPETPFEVPSTLGGVDMGASQSGWDVGTLKLKIWCMTFKNSLFQCPN